MTESASVVRRLYGLSNEDVAWQKDTGSFPGPGSVAAVCGAVPADVDGAGAVVVGAVVSVVVEDGGTVVVGDDDDGAVVGIKDVGDVDVVTPCASAVEANPTSGRAARATMRTALTSPRRTGRH
jgi:hypothetical protein